MCAVGSVDDEVHRDEEGSIWDGGVGGLAGLDGEDVNCGWGPAGKAMSLNARTRERGNSSEGAGGLNFGVVWFLAVHSCSGLT